MSQPDAQAQVELLARAQEEIKQLKGEVNQLKDELNQVSGIYDDEW
jgi:prefoldin subunit 5